MSYYLVTNLNSNEIIYSGDDERKANQLYDDCRNLNGYTVTFEQIFIPQQDIYQEVINKCKR